MKKKDLVKRIAGIPPSRIKWRRMREVDGGLLYPNDVKGWYFPNWFNKEHFETFLHRKITDGEFEVIKGFLSEQTDIYDKISNVVRDYLLSEVRFLSQIKGRK